MNSLDAYTRVMRKLKFEKLKGNYASTIFSVSNHPWID